MSKTASYFKVTHHSKTVLLKLSPSAFKLYFVLCYHARNHNDARRGECWPSQKNLAKAVGCQERWLRSLLNELQNAELVDIDEKKVGRTNRYWVALPDSLT